MLTFLIVLVAAAWNVLMWTLFDRRMDHTAIVLICAALDVTALFMGVWATRASFEWSSDGFRTRGVIDWAPVPWADITDYYTVPVRGRRARRAFAAVIVTKSATYRFDHLWSGVEGLMAAVEANAVRAKTHGWAIHGCRACDTQELKFRYTVPSLLIDGFNRLRDGVVTSPEGIRYNNGRSGIAASWDEVMSTHTGPDGRTIVETEYGIFDFTSGIRDSTLLRAIIAHRAPTSSPEASALANLDRLRDIFNEHNDAF